MEYLRIDSTGEYVKKNFEIYLEHDGIPREQDPTHSSQPLI